MPIQSCFYYLAKDPEDSFPKSYQPELGYTIAGEGEGKVDILRRVSDLFFDVRDNQAANISTFWTLNAIFQDLRDGHVGVPPVSGEPLVEWGLRIFPSRVIREGLVAKPEFSVATNGELVLKIFWQDQFDGSESESVVDTINGLTVPEFLFYMANTRSMYLAFQSVGARINQLLRILSAVDYNFFIFPLLFNTNPTEVLPSL